jgi:hypothetical protein
LVAFKSINSSLSSPSTSIVTLNGTSTQQIGGTLTFCTNTTLEIANNGGVDLQGNLAVNGTLKLSNGLLRTHGYTVALGNAATLTGEATGRYVVGNLQTTRTVGTGSSIFGGIGLDVATGSDNLGDITVLRQSGLIGQRTFGVNESINRAWTITAVQQPIAGRSVTFSWVSDDDNNKTISQAQVWHREGSSPWSVVGGVQDASVHNITVNTTQFSELTVSDAFSPLPITLRTFTGQQKERVAWLEWTTSSEKSNAGFEVERSADASEFETIGFVPALSSPQAINHYTFTDDGLGQGQYYRLRQLDIDGQYTLSKILFVEGSVTASLWPNPAIDRVHLTLPTKNSAELKLFSFDGMLLKQTKGSPDQLEMQLNRWLAILPVGLYSLQIWQDGRLLPLRMMKQ